MLVLNLETRRLSCRRRSSLSSPQSPQAIGTPNNSTEIDLAGRLSGLEQALPLSWRHERSQPVVPSAPAFADPRHGLELCPHYLVRLKSVMDFRSLKLRCFDPRLFHTLERSVSCASQHLSTTTTRLSKVTGSEFQLQPGTRHDPNSYLSASLPIHK